MSIRAAALVGSIAIAGACGRVTAFTCSEDEDCRDGAREGRCEADHYCSFVDPDCPSRRRYAELAPAGLAGMCVQDEAGSTGTGGMGNTSSSSDTAASSSTGGGPIPADWWDPAWHHRVALSIDVTDTDDDLVDVPILVVLDDPRVDLSALTADGRDLRFVSGDGDLVYAHEIDAWSDDERAIWVRVPVISGGGDPFWLYYGNADADAIASSQVWADHVAVFHMGSEIIDASGALDSAPAAVGATRGMFGDASVFDASGPTVLGDLAPLRGLFLEGASISAWIRVSDWGVGGDWGRILDKMDLPFDGAGYSVMVQSEGRFRFVQGFSPTESGWETAAGTLAAGTWTYVSMSYQAIDGTTPPQMYIDGEPRAIAQTTAGTGAPLGDDGVPFALGGRAGVEPRNFQGDIDELRIERIVHSSAWHRVQYRSMTDALLVWGARESID